MNAETIDALLQSSLDVAFPAAQLVVWHKGACVLERAIGYTDPDARQNPISMSTRFDLASVSKLFTVAAFMRLVDAGATALDAPVSSVLPTFADLRPIQPQTDPLGSGTAQAIVPPTDEKVDAGQITFRQVLSHSSGLPAWLPLWKVAWAAQRDGVLDGDIQRQLRAMALQTAFAYPTSTRVVYSDVGLIITGWAVEQLTGKPLDAAVREWVTRPLGLDSVSYGPIPCDDTAPTEFYTHQNRRMCGEVHDENAFSLNGVAGHAGLFADAHDVALFGEALRAAWTGKAQSFLRHETLREMTHLQAQDGDVRRGIGFALRSPNPVAMSNALGAQAFGHLGFTGTALWIDPERELTFACLTNHIYYGRNSPDTMTPFRAALSRAIVDAL